MGAGGRWKIKGKKQNDYRLANKIYKEISHHFKLFTVKKMKWLGLTWRYFYTNCLSNTDKTSS